MSKIGLGFVLLAASAFASTASAQECCGTYVVRPGFGWRSSVVYQQPVVTTYWTTNNYVVRRPIFDRVVWRPAPVVTSWVDCCGCPVVYESMDTVVSDSMVMPNTTNAPSNPTEGGEFVESPLEIHTSTRPNIDASNTPGEVNPVPASTQPGSTTPDNTVPQTDNDT